MEIMTLKEIAKAVDGRVIGNENLLINSVTTDSRNIEKKDLFIALRGENFDGHDFIADFFNNGGIAVVSEEENRGENIVLVEDTRKALLDIAAYYRKKFDIPIIAITGSVGKTSTKDMLHCVMSQKGKTLKTQGNFNNEIGVPLTIFNLDNNIEIAILEMGMNHFGEISRLTNAVRPTAAVITNIGMAHIGYLGGQEGILKAKLEILEGLSKDSLVVLNGDDKSLYNLKGSLPFRTIFYGIDNLNCDILAYNIVLGRDKSKFDVKIEDKEYHFETNVVGGHHVYNVLASIALGIEYGISVNDIQKGVSEFQTGSMRQSIIDRDDIRIIEDCYNASPDSMESALRVMYQLGGRGRKIAVLGDMLEMGEYAEEMHRYIGRRVAENRADVLVTVGTNAKLIAAEARKCGVFEIQSFDDKEEALEYLNNNTQKNDTILFKASRKMKFEELSQGLKPVLKNKDTLKA